MSQIHCEIKKKRAAFAARVFCLAEKKNDGVLFFEEKYQKSKRGRIPFLNSFFVASRRLVRTSPTTD